MTERNWNVYYVPAAATYYAAMRADSAFHVDVLTGFSEGYARNQAHLLNTATDGGDVLMLTGGPAHCPTCE